MGEELVLRSKERVSLVSRLRMFLGVIGALLECSFRLGVAGGVDGDVESRPGGSGCDDSSRRTPPEWATSEGWLESGQVLARCEDESIVTESCCWRNQASLRQVCDGDCTNCREPPGERLPQSLDRKIWSRSPVNATSLLPSPLAEGSKLTYWLNKSLNEWSNGAANMVTTFLSACG